MAQLGYHPGAPFLDAWAPALCRQMHAPATAAGGHDDGGEAEEHRQDPWQNLSLAFVVRFGDGLDCLRVWRGAFRLANPPPAHNYLITQQPP